MEPVLWTWTDGAARAKELGAAYLTLGSRLPDVGELMATSLVVSVHLSHNADTDGFITRELFGPMLTDAIFTNTARAEVVDNEALTELVEAGSIFGVGLDTFADEPPAPDAAPVSTSTSRSPRTSGVTQTKPTTSSSWQAKTSSRS